MAGSPMCSGNEHGSHSEIFAMIDSEGHPGGVSIYEARGEGNARPLRSINRAAASEEINRGRRTGQSPVASDKRTQQCVGADSPGDDRSTPGVQP